MKRRLVRMELGLKVGLGQEPSFPAVQSFRESRPVPVKWDTRSCSGQAEGESRRVHGQLERRLGVLGEKVLPFCDVVVAEEVKGFWGKKNDLVSFFLIFASVLGSSSCRLLSCPISGGP